MPDDLRALQARGCEGRGVCGAGLERPHLGSRPGPAPSWLPGITWASDSPLQLEVLGLRKGSDHATFKRNQCYPSLVPGLLGDQQRSTVTMATQLGLKRERPSLWEQPEHMWLQKRNPPCGRRGPEVLAPGSFFPRGLLRSLFIYHVELTAGGTEMIHFSTGHPTTVIGTLCVS